MSFKKLDGDGKQFLERQALAGLFRGKAVWESVRLTDGGKLLYNQIQ